MPPPPISSARPGFAVGGADNAGLAGNLLELAIVQRTGEPCRCNARFANPAAGSGDFLYSDRALLDFGKQFVVKMNGATIFDGRIFGLEAGFPDGAPADIAVLAADRLEDLQMTRRTRSFENLTDGEVVQRIAGDHGLTANVNLDGPAHRLLAQINQTDFAFITERVSAADAVLWIDDRTLHVGKARAPLAVAPRLTWGQNLRQFSATADLTAQRTRLSVAGWDVAGKSAIAYEAGDSVLGDILSGGDSGAQILAQAFGERKDAIVSAVPLNDEEARQRADGAFRRMARRFVIGRGVADIDARLQAGAPVEVSGVGGLAGGIYYLSEVKHVFDAANGARTEFIAGSAGLRPA